MSIRMSSYCPTCDHVMWFYFSGEAGICEIYTCESCGYTIRITVR